MVLHVRGSPYVKSYLCWFSLVLGENVVGWRDYMMEGTKVDSSVIAAREKGKKVFHVSAISRS